MPAPRVNTALTASAPNSGSIAATEADTLWTIEECARYLQRSPRWLYLAVRREADTDGSIPHTRLPGGAVRFIPEHVRGWVAAGCPPAAVFKNWHQK